MSFKTLGWVAGASSLSVAAWQAHLYCVETNEMLKEANQSLQNYKSNQPIFYQSLETIRNKEIVQKEIDDLTNTDRKCHFFKNFFSHKH